MKDVPAKSTGDTLTADEYTAGGLTELKNVVTSGGQTLDDTGADQLQIAKSISDYASGADFYTDSGVADAYSLTPLSTRQSPDIYRNGMRIRFIAGNSNTGTSTVNVNGLGVKNLTNNGEALDTGDIRANTLVTAYYAASADQFYLDSNYTLLVVGQHQSYDSGVENVPCNFRVTGTGSNDSRISIAEWSADTTPPGLSFVKSRGTTVGTFDAAVEIGDTLGRIAFGGDDGDEQITNTNISVEVNQTVSDGSIPTETQFINNSVMGLRTGVFSGVAGSATVIGGSTVDPSYMSLNVSRRLVVESTAAAVGVRDSGTTSAWSMVITDDDLLWVDDSDSAGISGSRIRFRFDYSNGAFTPGQDNVQNLGSASLRWDTVYAGTGTINTSDENEKLGNKPIDDLLLDAFDATPLEMFQMKDAYQLKGDSARWHCGVVSQKLADNIRDLGGNPEDYAVWCKDEWEDYRDEHDIFYPAGSREGVRYHDLWAIKAASDIRKLAVIEQRITDLEGA
jgi:hypothetical protein